MKVLKRIISAALSAAVLAGVCPSAVSAAQKEKSSIIFDINGDKVTDGKDIEAFKSYAPNLVRASEDFGLFPTQIIYGDVRSTDYDTSQADSIPRYFLTNINLSTTPKFQGSRGDCWAFAAVGALESAALKADELAKNPSGAVDPKAFSEPVLSGLEDKYDFSEKAVAWFMGEPLTSGENPAQAGEGFSIGGDSTARFDLGGPSSYPETLFTAWRAVLPDSVAPHTPENWDGTVNGMTKYGTNWSLPKDLGATSSETPRVSDYLLLPPTSRIKYDYSNGDRLWQSCDKKARSIVKQALLEYGAVSILYDASPTSENDSFYHSYDKADPNHVNLIVGWDDNYSKTNFSTEESSMPPENGAWLVKNSYGSYDYWKSVCKNWDEDREGINGMSYADSVAYAQKRKTTLEDLKKKGASVNKNMCEWGIRDENDRGTGYFWLSYFDRSMGANYVYKADSAADGYDYDNNYQYDYAMCSDDLRFSFKTADKNTLFGNVFVSNGNEKLKAFSAYTNETDSFVRSEIYLLDGTESNPTEGKLVYSDSRSVKFAGFHTIRLDKEISLSKGQKFAVVQNVTSKESGSGEEVSYLGLETDVNGRVLSDKYKVDSKTVSNDGETYVRLDGKWTTPKQLNESLEISEIFTFGNAKIKAFTVNAASTVVPKKANPVSVTVKSTTISLKKLRKKSQTVKPLTVKNARGKLSFALKSVPKKLRKLLKINSKGALTVKRWKKAKKGTYKLKVKITAKGDSLFNSKTVTKTVKLKIK